MPACFNTPSKKNSIDTFRGFQKVGFQWEKTDRQVISVWENLWFSLWESEWRPWRFSLKKWEPPDAGFYPAFAFEHLQHHPGDDLTDFFPHPSLVLYSFATPPIKLKPRGSIIVMGQPSRQRRDHIKSDIFCRHPSPARAGNAINCAHSLYSNTRV